MPNLCPLPAFEKTGQCRDSALNGWQRSLWTATLWSGMEGPLIRCRSFKANASRASPHCSVLPYMSQAKHRKISGNFCILSSLDCGVSCSSCHPSNHKCFSKSHKIYDDVFVFQCPTFQTLPGQKWVKGCSQWHIFSHVIHLQFQSWEGCQKFNIILHIFI